MQNPVTIYGPAFSNYVRSVMLCCEEADIAYQLESPAKNSTPHPFGKVPVLNDDGFIVFETAAICRYLDQRSGSPILSPTDLRQLAWMDQWISAANCYFDPMFIRSYLLELVMPKGENGQINEGNVSAALPEVDRYLQIANMALQTQPYFSGQQPGIADYLIMPMIDYLYRSSRIDAMLENVTRLAVYYAEMKLRPSCEKVLVAPQMPG